MKDKWIFASLVIFAAGTLMIGCSRGNGKELKFSGTLELTEHSLGAKVAGRLASLHVDEGSRVKTGDVIATLDRFEQAQKDHKRWEGLLKAGGATVQDLEYAALALDDQRIVSPVDGIVLVKVREVGEIVSAGSPVIVVGDRRSLWVRIYVPEGLINKIKLGQPAVLHFDGISSSFTGKVTFIAPQAEFTPRNVQTAEERVTQTFAVKVTLDTPPEYLRPGVAADVAIETEK